MPNFLKLTNLSATARSKTVIQNINLVVGGGEVHALMGPNGSGKSSLALTIMGSPDYKVRDGKALLNSQDLLSLKPNQRAKSGLFLTFQNPIFVPGVTLGQLAWVSCKNIIGEKTDARQFHDKFTKQVENIGLKEEMLERSLNDGFSGGEKKKAEILLLSMLPAKFIIFDEIDSGLDVDSLEKIAKIINRMIKKGTGVILITHNLKILRFIKPDFVHVMKEGKIVKEGGYELAKYVEEQGFRDF